MKNFKRFTNLITTLLRFAFHRRATMAAVLLLVGLATIAIAQTVYPSGTIANTRRLHGALISAGVLTGSPGYVTNGACLLAGGTGCIMTGQIRAAAGSAATPSLSPSTDTNTGLYSVGADQLGVSAGGTLRATLSASGLNLAAGEGYSIGGTSVVNATTLGSGVVASSLTSVGSLTSLSTGDVTFPTGLAGGADLTCASAAADTAGQSIDVTGQTGGTASTDQDGAPGGLVTLTGGAGSALNGTGTNDGSGGDLVLAGGAKGGATGTAVDGFVRVGSPTVGSTKTTSLLAVGGGLEVDGLIRGDTGLTISAGTVSMPSGEVDATEIADASRSIPLPLTGWYDCTTKTVISIDDAADAQPDIAVVQSGLVIAYDDTGGSVDTNSVCTSFTVPPDYASGGAFVARVTQDGATAGQIETFSCDVSFDGAALVGANAGNNVDQTAIQSVTATPVVSYVAGGSVAVLCKQGNASADDLVNIHSIQWTYTSVQ